MFVDTTRSTSRMPDGTYRETQNGMIPRVCEAAADFCEQRLPQDEIATSTKHLIRRALDRSHRDSSSSDPFRNQLELKNARAHQAIQKRAQEQTIYDVELAKLKENAASIEAESIKQAGEPVATQLPIIEKEKARKAFVIPILEAKGWSSLDWATESRVSYHTAADYLEGSTDPYRSTRLKLAKSLGVAVDALPQ
jgi:hypothetical protein